MTPANMSRTLQLPSSSSSTIILKDENNFNLRRPTILRLGYPGSTASLDTMAPRQKDEGPLSKFTKLAFRDPFSDIQRPASAPNPVRSNTDAISPVSLPTTLYSEPVSTLASAIPSPDFDECSHCEKLTLDTTTFPFGACGLSAELLTPDEKIVVIDEALSPGSSIISPLGTPIREFRSSILGGSLEEPGTAVDGGADSLQSNNSNLKTSSTSKLCE